MSSRTLLNIFNSANQQNPKMHNSKRKEHAKLEST
jgi:hypothetical protein